MRFFCLLIFYPCMRIRFFEPTRYSYWRTCTCNCMAIPIWYTCMWHIFSTGLYEEQMLFVEIFHMGELSWGAQRWSPIRTGKWGLQGDSQTAKEVQMQTFSCQRKLLDTCTYKSYNYKTASMCSHELGG